MWYFNSPGRSLRQLKAIFKKRNPPERLTIESILEFLFNYGNAYA